MESVIRVSPRDDFTLELWFNTGDHRLFDMTPYLDRGAFIKLNDLPRTPHSSVGLTAFSH